MMYSTYIGTPWYTKHINIHVIMIQQRLPCLAEVTTTLTTSVSGHHEAVRCGEWFGVFFDLDPTQRQGSD